MASLVLTDSSQLTSDSQHLALSCPRLTPPKYGQLTPSSCALGKSFHGQHCIASCVRGFVLTGKAVVTCLPRSHQWSHPVSACVRGVPPAKGWALAGSLLSGGGGRVMEYSGVARIFAREVFISKATDSIPEPFIQCPRDIKVDLPPRQRYAHIRIQQPKSNMDWWRYEPIPSLLLFGWR
uniref:(California timema) hypothetical protein n=1 Tax=Timema californicum TaxID=61474 RepID=A0A7R9PD25_TIMCA|nr:unnamed protein product [Timema californicum]